MRMFGHRCVNGQCAVRCAFLTEENYDIWAENVYRTVEEIKDHLWETVKQADGILQVVRLIGEGLFGSTMTDLSEGWTCPLINLLISMQFDMTELLLYLNAPFDEEPRSHLRDILREVEEIISHQ